MNLKFYVGIWFLTHDSLVYFFWNMTSGTLDPFKITKTQWLDFGKSNKS